MFGNKACSRAVVGAAALALTIGAAIATAQQGDTLILDGKEYVIYTNPLEPWLDEHPDRRPKSDTVSTDLWRGYVATWEILDGRLCLTDVSARKGKPESVQIALEFQSVMSEVFPGERRVAATWFSGHLIIPQGELIEYEHLGYASTFQKYIVVTVQEGVVAGQARMDASRFMAFRRSQFRAYQRTEEYRTLLQEMKRSGLSDSELEKFLFGFLSERYLSRIFESEP